MLPVCCAFAYAIELSESTFAAMAALIGAATFALINDMAARSGSSSPAIAFNSSVVSFRYSSAMIPPLVALRNRRVLDGVRVCDRPVAERVERDSRIDGRRDVGVHERHRRALRQLFARES